MSFRPLLPMALALVALAACERPSEMPPATDLKAFRDYFPLDETKADAALADYALAQTALMQRTANGGRAEVALLTADGKVHSGYDEFVSSGEARTREVRDNYTAVQVGDVSCVLAPEPPSCRKTPPLHLGLPPVQKDLLVRFWTRDLPCPSMPGRCRFYKFLLGGVEIAPDGVLRYGEPELVGHEIEVMFSLLDHVPIYYKQTDHFGVGLAATAFYVFTLNRPIAPIELPPNVPVTPPPAPAN